MGDEFEVIEVIEMVVEVNVDVEVEDDIDKVGLAIGPEKPCTLEQQESATPDFEMAVLQNFNA